MKSKSNSVPVLSAGNFYGIKHDDFVSPSVRLAENRYTPSYKIPKHSHEHPYFGLVLEGAYAETFERRTRECRPSTLLFHPAGETHSESHYDVTVRIFSIEPSTHLLGKIYELAQLDTPLEASAGPLNQIGSSLFREFCLRDEFSALAIEGMVLELLANLLRESNRYYKGSIPPAWLTRVKEMLHETCFQPPSLIEIANVAGKHPTHVARIFRQYFHCTMGDYLRSLRIEYAKGELSSATKSIADISYTAGYCDQSHFSTVFKRHTGMSPAAYRKRTSER